MNRVPGFERRFAWLFEDRRFTYLSQSLGVIGGLALLREWSTPFQIAALSLVVIPVLILGHASRDTSFLYPITREKMTSLGEQIIRAANTELIFFSGDMSWVGSYSDAIRGAIRQGKRVTVHHDKSVGEVLTRNLEHLNQLGCSVIYSPVALPIRGILVDPSSRQDCALYIARRRRRGNTGLQLSGEPGTDMTHGYWAAVYSSQSDDVRIDLAHSLHLSRIPS